MSTVTIDLTKNPDIAALVADKEPASRVYGAFTVKSRDDQTLVLRIEEMADAPDDLPTGDVEDQEDDGDDDDGDEAPEKVPAKPGKSLADKLTASESGGDGMGF